MIWLSTSLSKFLTPRYLYKQFYAIATMIMLKVGYSSTTNLWLCGKKSNCCITCREMCVCLRTEISHDRLSPFAVFSELPPFLFSSLSLKSLFLESCDLIPSSHIFLIILYDPLGRRVMKSFTTIPIQNVWKEAVVT